MQAEFRNEPAIPVDRTLTRSTSTIKVFNISYSWNIEKFSSFPQKHGDFIKSAHFPAGSFNDLDCELHLYPNGDDTVPPGEFLSIHLLLLSKSEEISHCQFQISILDNDGIPRNVQTVSCNSVDISSPHIGSLTSQRSSLTSQRSWQMSQVVDHDSSPFVLRQYLSQVVHSCFKLTEITTFSRFASLASLRSSSNRLMSDDKLEIQCSVSVTYRENITTCSRSYASFNPNIELTRLFDKFSSFLRDQKHCDVTLVSGGKSYPAHKVILASRSSVFDAMFNHDMSGNINNVVNIPDGFSNVLEDFLLFIYTGKSELLNQEPFNYHKAEELLRAAKTYDVPMLENLCSDYLISNLNADNACNILYLADLLKDDNLKQHAMYFIKKYIRFVVESKAWIEVSKLAPNLIAEIIK